VTTETQVPTLEICSRSKRWWTKELMDLCRQMNILGRRSYTRKFRPAHPVHDEHKEAIKLYDRMLEHTKNQHWRDWLKHTTDPDIWTVHKFISAPALDRAKAHIPALKHKRGDDEEMANTNPEKA
jgi:hypothetical protein